MTTTVEPQHHADLRPPFYRTGGDRVRIAWNGTELVWVNEGTSEPADLPETDCSGLMPEFSFRGRNV
jgi:hypothetical protein